MKNLESTNELGESVAAHEKTRAVSEYEELLSHIHPNFSSKLVSIAPNLTPMEVVVCTLTRLHLRTKEAAELLNLSPSSVESHRSHARAKLGMSRSQQFASTLHRI